MSNVACIRHKDYKGTTSPILTCKACCSIFVAAIKARQPEVSVTDWLSNKQKEYEERWGK